VSQKVGQPSPLRRNMIARRLVWSSSLLLAGVILLACFAVVVQPVKPMESSYVLPVDADRLKQHVIKLSQEFHPRNVAHARNLDAAAAYIRGEFVQAGARVSEQAVTAPAGRFRNVIAAYGPSDGPLLVIGAHYDTDGDTPGADDNASGVAGLLELARLLQKHPPTRAVELVAYSLEEMPYFKTEHMGSAHHARALRASGRAVEVMISLEMIGYFSDEPSSQTYPLPGLSLVYPSHGNFIAIVGRTNEWRETRRLKAAMRGASPLPVHSINTLVAIPGFDLSDHQSFWNEGFPAVMVTDTAFFRNPHYHARTDTFDTLDYVRLGNVVQGVFTFAVIETR